MTPHILLFAGTTEGRELAQALAGRGYRLTLSVATEYGGELLSREGLPGSARILTGRLDQEEMARLIDSERIACAIDATHPYALEAAKNIRGAAERAGIAHLKLQRPQELADAGVCLPSAREGAEYLDGVEGNILFTTGTKDLPVYKNVRGFFQRGYVRVLPTVESIAQVRDMGISAGRIIAMQGPFSKQMNLAIFRQFDIRCMVTKNSGDTGGYREKVEAAREAGVLVVTIVRADQGVLGLTRQGILGVLKERFGL